MARYHFEEFVLSPRRRLLLRGGKEQPLIPRYFDLRVLDDDPKEPRFIRTVSRHGYRFVFTDVREEEDAATLDIYMREQLENGTLMVTDASRAMARAILYPPKWFLLWPAFRAMQLITIGSLPASMREAYGFNGARVTSGPLFAGRN